MLVNGGCPMMTVSLRPKDSMSNLFQIVYQHPGAWMKHHGLATNIIDLSHRCKEVMKDGSIGIDVRGEDPGWFIRGRTTDIGPRTWTHRLGRFAERRDEDRAIPGRARSTYQTHLGGS